MDLLPVVSIQCCVDRRGVCLSIKPKNSDEDLRQHIMEQVEQLIESDDIRGALSMLQGQPPADVAEIVEELDSAEQVSLLRQLAEETAGEVLDELSEGTVREIAEALPGVIARAASYMEPDELADLLNVLDVEKREIVFQNLPAEEARQARSLLEHPSDTAGGIMTPDFVLLASDITAGQAVEITQSSRESETLARLFVSNEEGQLLGHLPFHKLVFAGPNRDLKDLIEPEIATVTPETDQEEVVRLASRYGMDFVPVVDQTDRLIGVVTSDDILEAEQEEVDEDMYRLAGTTEKDPVRATVLRSTRLRLPWLLLTLLGGLGIAFMVSRFENTLEAVQIAFFIPVIPLMGGNVAIQASTIVVRGLAVGDIQFGRLLTFSLKQGVVTLLLAILCGLAAAVLGLLFPNVNQPIAALVGLAVFVAILTAGSLGTLLPLAFDKYGLDPAISAGPFVTILNDVICILIYLLLGAALV